MTKSLAVFAVLVFCWAFFGMITKQWPLWLTLITSVTVSGVATFIVAVPLEIIRRVLRFIREED